MDDAEVMIAYTTLKAAWQKAKRHDGFSTTQDIASAAGWGERELSRWVARCTFRDWLVIVDHYRGLPCDGDGLNADPTYQVIKLRFDH